MISADLGNIANSGVRDTAPNKCQWSVPQSAKPATVTVTDDSLLLLRSRSHIKTRCSSRENIQRSSQPKQKVINRINKPVSAQFWLILQHLIPDSKPATYPSNTVVTFCFDTRNTAWRIALSLMPNEVLTWWPLITFLVSWFFLIFRYGNKSRLWLPIYTAY